MNWIDLAWLGMGLVGGVVVGAGWSKRWRSQPSVLAEAIAQPNLDRTEQGLQEQLQQLQLVYQMATEMSHFKGGFLARISHELRSPLNGMIGMHQLILSELCDSPEEEREFVAQAHQAALKMVAVLDTILDVARLQHGTSSLIIQPLQLATVLQHVHDLTALPAKDRNLRFKVTLPDPELYVLADPRRFQQVLLFLVDAAIAQMHEGAIQVAVQIVAASESAHIWIDRDLPDEAAIHPFMAALSEPIALLDTPLTTMPSLKTATPSPGLNLLLAQMLMEQMHGTLETMLLPAEETPNHQPQVRMQCSIPLVVPD